MLTKFLNIVLIKINGCIAIYRDQGSFFLLKKIVFYPVTVLYRFAFLFRIRFMSVQNRFLEIYSKNYWKCNESISGVGSTILQTENLRKNLPIIFNDLKIGTLLDAPCGDFNWMQHVIIGSNIDYVGVDIVPPLINDLNKKYSCSSIKFIHRNILEDPLPYSDLLIARDFLFHLSFEDINKFIRNYIKSNIPYILTTTHENSTGFLNKDIITGDFRKIDLFSAPFSFPDGVLYCIKDYKAPEPPRYMCLWERNQILSICSNNDKSI